MLSVCSGLEVPEQQNLLQNHRLLKAVPVRLAVLSVCQEGAVSILEGVCNVSWSLQGFQRVYDELPEISVDVPRAHAIMEAFVDLCFQEAVITKQLRDTCPSR